MSKYGFISGPYFLVFGLNTEIYGVNQYSDSKLFHTEYYCEACDYIFADVRRRFDQIEFNLHFHIKRCYQNLETVY